MNVAHTKRDPTESPSPTKWEGSPFLNLIPNPSPNNHLHVPCIYWYRSFLSRRCLALSLAALSSRHAWTSMRASWMPRRTRCTSIAISFSMVSRRSSRDVTCFGGIRDVGEMGVRGDVGVDGAEESARDASGGKASFGRRLALRREGRLELNDNGWVSRWGEEGGHGPMVMVGSGPASVVNSSSGRRLLPERRGDSEMFTGRSGALDWVAAMVAFAAQVGWVG